MKKLILSIFIFTSTVSVSQVLNYNFTSTAGTYAANASPTTIHGSGADDAMSAAINIGFNFQYNCQTYTQFKASSNGWMTFNTSITGANATNNLDGTSDRPIIAPLWDDLETDAGGNVNYQLTGTSPNRVLTIEWKEMLWNFGASNWGLSFQCKLYETTNRIEFVYIRNGNAGANLNSPSASIGLVGQSAGDYYSLNDVSASPVASKVTETDNLSSKPSSGRVYGWDPVLCSGIPTAGTSVATPSTNCGNFTTVLSLSGSSSSGCGISYLWYHANTLGGAYTAIGTASSSPSQTFAVTSASTKFFKCVVTCGASSATSTPISASVSAMPVGTGNYSVTLPFSSGAQTNCGMVNDFTSSNVSAVCGSSSYYGGEDVLYAFTPTVTAAINASVTSSGTYMGMTIYQGCPTNGGICVANAQSSAGNQNISSCSNVVTAGTTYYLILDSYPAPNCNPYNLNISLSSCSGMPVAGTPNARPNAMCSNFTTTLSLTGNSSDCGITYLWHHANTFGGAYTAIGSASSTSTQTFAVTSASAKFFKCVVTCGASSATTAVISASVNEGVVGSGSYSVSLPYSSGAQTTCGFVNDLTSSNVNAVCGSSSYYGGEDVVYVFTPTATVTFTAGLTSSGNSTGMMLYNGCPTSTGICVANLQSGVGSKTLSTNSGCGSITLNAGQIYFLILDSNPTPTCNPYSISLMVSSATSTVPPCGFNYSVAPTTFSFETFSGTVLPTTDDVLFDDYIDLGFPFCFDGKSFSGGYVASNSSFVFDAIPCFPNIGGSTYAAGGVSTGFTIPSAAPVNGTSIPRNAILAPWHDIYPNYSGRPASCKIQYQVTGTSPNRKAVISWEDVPMYGSSCHDDVPKYFSSQIKIFEFDGSIEIHIKNKRVCASHNDGDAVLGLHNYDGTIYIPPVDMVSHNYPTNWTMSNTAYKYTTPCSNTSGCLTVLPIGFKNFYGDKIDEVNTLFWNTATEENMSHFIIEQSVDAINFVDIGKVNAKNTAWNYTFKDYKADDGIISYYRIRAVELDGQTARTNVVSIGANENDLLSTWPIYPNPTHAEINIRLNVKKQGSAQFIIYDMLGNAVLNTSNQLETGVKVYSMDVSGLAKGVYFVEIQNNLNEIISKQKLVIQN